MDGPEYLHIDNFLKTSFLLPGWRIVPAEISRVSEQPCSTQTDRWAIYQR